MLGVGTSTVRRLEASGDLTPEIGERGRRLFDPAQVERLRAARGVAREGRVDPDVDVDDDDEDDEDAEVGAPEDAVAAADVVALVFADLREGISPVDIVIDRQLDPRLVEALCERYARLAEIGANLPDAHARMAAIEQRNAELLGVLHQQQRMINGLGWELHRLPGVAASLAHSADVLAAVATYHDACG